MALGASMGLQTFVPYSPWNWLLLLVVLRCSEASSTLEKSANFTVEHETNVRFAAASSEPDEKISVFALDYDYVQIPYEVTLWILLASLAKIGKSPKDLVLGAVSARDNLCENSL